MVSSIIAAHIREARLFSGLSDTEIHTLARTASWHNVKRHRTLFRRGEMAEAAFLLASGAVRLSCGETKGREKVVSFVQSSGTFGETTLCPEQRYPYSATTQDDCILFVFEGPVLRQWLSRHPALYSNLLAKTFADLHEIVDHLESLYTLNADQRIADYLLQRWNERDVDEDEVHCPSRWALASFLNLSAETLCRTLGKFRRQGWITTQGNCISLREPKMLERVIAGRLN